MTAASMMIALVALLEPAGRPTALPPLECRNERGEVTVAAESIHDLDDSVVKPEVIERVQPVWPEGRHRLGVVVVESIIDATGAVCAVRVLKAPEEKLGRAAAAALGKWRFTPARLDGEPVPVRFHFTANLHPQ